LSHHSKNGDFLPARWRHESFTLSTAAPPFFQVHIDFEKKEQAGRRRRKALQVRRRQKNAIRAGPKPKEALSVLDLPLIANRNRRKPLTLFVEKRD
jgi:hypothetical protein